MSVLVDINGLMPRLKRSDHVSDLCLHRPVDRGAELLLSEPFRAIVCPHFFKINEWIITRKGQTYEVLAAQVR